MTLSLVAVNDFLYGNLLIYILIAGGLYFGFKTRFVQFRRFNLAVKSMLKSRTTECDSHVSGFQAFCTSLAGRIGTGNLAGVALAIHLGGPGAIFWMWVIAFFGMATSLAENVLAQIYKVDNGDGTYRGGPAYYIEKAIGSRWLGVLFSLSLILAYSFAFISVQANSIAAAFENYHISNMYIGIGLVFLSALIVFRGIRVISKFSEIVVPAMAVIYLGVAFVVIGMNVTQVPDIFMTIIYSAFGIKSAAGGAVGAAIINGVRRGLFSNEAGIGSAPNVAATAHSDHPVTQGFMGMLGVFMDTIVVCTATAFIILMSGLYQSEITGIALTQASLVSQIGPWGQHIMTIAVLLFAFSTIVANYYYGESSVRFIINSNKAVFVYRIAILAMIYWGSVASLPIVWSFADLSMGLMALINMGAIIYLSKIVFDVLKDYEHQINQGVTNPVFDRKKFKFIDETLCEDAWTKKTASVSNSQNNTPLSDTKTA